MPVRATVTVLVLAVALSGATSEAIAAPSPEKPSSAMEHFRNGTRLYDLGEYARALEEYKAAFLETEDPACLFNIAQCHRKLGDRVQAIERYRSYLRRKPDAKNRAEVERIIADLERVIADSEKAKSAPPAGTTAVTGAVPGSAPAAPSGPPQAAVPPAPPPAPPPAAPPVITPATPSNEAPRPVTVSLAAPPASPPPVAPAAGPAPAAPPPAGPPGLYANPATVPAPGAPAYAGGPYLTAAGQPPAGRSAAESGAFYSSWWFWTAIGVLVAGGVVAGVALSSSGSSKPPCDPEFVCQ